jgi:hypothetical protein
MLAEITHDDANEFVQLMCRIVPTQYSDVQNICKPLKGIKIFILDIFKYPKRQYLQMCFACSNVHIYLGDFNRIQIRLDICK